MIERRDASVWESARLEQNSLPDFYRYNSRGSKRQAKRKMTNKRQSNSPNEYTRQRPVGILHKFHTKKQKQL